MSKEKKGIQIKALATELGVESRAIIAWLKAENLGDPAQHLVAQSTISNGLALTVRADFPKAQPGNVAVAIEADDNSSKPKSKGKSKKKTDDASTESADVESSDAHHDKSLKVIHK